jgi:hypothetical protein
MQEPTMPSIRRTALALLTAALAAVGCDEGSSYSTAAPTPAPTTTKTPAATGSAPAAPPTDPTGRRQSSSVLGKARDKALDVRDQMEARDREIQKQIDDIQP